MHPCKEKTTIFCNRDFRSSYFVRSGLSENEIISVLDSLNENSAIENQPTKECNESVFVVDNKGTG